MYKDSPQNQKQSTALPHTIDRNRQIESSKQSIKPFIIQRSIQIPEAKDGKLVNRKRGKSPTVQTKIQTKKIHVRSSLNTHSQLQREDSVEPVEAKKSEKDATDSLEFRLEPSNVSLRRGDQKIIKQLEERSNTNIEKLPENSQVWKRQEVSLEEVLQRGLHYGGTEVKERFGQLRLKIPYGEGRVAEMEWDQVARVSPSWLLGFVEGFWL